jgi:hypothetical protein
MSKKYLLPCRCGREIPVEAAQAGQRVRCECDAELDVPTMLGLARLQLFVEPAGAAQVPRRGWSIRHRLAFIGGVIFLAGLVWMAGVWRYRPKSIDISRISPSQALGLWNLLRDGIATPQTRDELVYNAVLQRNTHWLFASAAVAFLGALIAGSAWLVGNRSGQGPAQRKGPEANG